jgi:hypothetical protein
MSAAILGDFKLSLSKKLKIAILQSIRFVFIIIKSLESDSVVQSSNSYQ